MLVQWMSRDDGFKDLIHLDTGDILASMNLDVSFIKFDLNILDNKSVEILQQDFVLGVQKVLDLSNNKHQGQFRRCYNRYGFVYAWRKLQGDQRAFKTIFGLESQSRNHNEMG